MRKSYIKDNIVKLVGPFHKQKIEIKKVVDNLIL